MKKTVFLLLAGLGAGAPAAAQVCNSAIRASTPAADFVDNGDGTVTHAKTGLMWKKCAEGQRKAPLFNRCIGDAAYYTWQGALQRANSLNANGGYADYTDWRVPNMNELTSIVEDKCYGPAINGKIFPDTPSTSFWSASPDAYFSFYAWIVYFVNGFDNFGYKYSDRAVRLVRGGQFFDAFGEERVVVLLHGMNSKPQAWDDLKTAYFKDCPVIYNGVSKDGMAGLNAYKTRCYRVRFGKHDKDPGNDQGLENARDYGEANGLPLAGDFSTFAQLGQEVRLATIRVRNYHPGAKIVLLGHSRGGLAARAYLQDTAPSAAKQSIAGLITTGTPHAGSRLARFYKYIENNLLQADKVTRKTDTAWRVQDWEVVDFLLDELYWIFPKNRLDVRRPTIRFLADNSPDIQSLQDGKGNLPAAIRYGQIAYSQTDLGWLTGLYTVFGPDADLLGEQVSLHAQNNLLSGLKPADYQGDGIVTEASQQAGLPENYLMNVDGNVLHTEEPGRTLEIAMMFCDMKFSRWLSVCPVPALPATATGAAKSPATESKPSQEERRLAAAVEHRQREYNRWLQTPAEALWTQWRDTTAERDAARRELLGSALLRRLQQGEGDSVYRQAGHRLSQTSVALLERARLAALLGETATPQALQILLQQLRENPDPALRDALLAAIGQIGDYRWEERFHDELSPLLQAAWRDAGDDAALLTELAQALAKVGTPEDITLLLQVVEQSGQPVRILRENYRSLPETDVRALAAWRSLDDLRNPDAVPVLAEALQRHAPGDAAFKAAGDGLAAMGLAQATEVLMQWAEQAPDDAKPYAEQWFGRVRDEASMRVLRQALSRRKAFHSGAVFDGVRGAFERLEAR